MNARTEQGVGACAPLTFWLVDPFSDEDLKKACPLCGRSSDPDTEIYWCPTSFDRNSIDIAYESVGYNNTYNLAVAAICSVAPDNKALFSLCAPHRKEFVGWFITRVIGGSWRAMDRYADATGWKSGDHYYIDQDDMIKIAGEDEEEDEYRAATPQELFNNDLRRQAGKDLYYQKCAEILSNLSAIDTHEWLIIKIAGLAKRKEKGLRLDYCSVSNCKGGADGEYDGKPYCGQHLKSAHKSQFFQVEESARKVLAMEIIGYVYGDAA